MATTRTRNDDEDIDRIFAELEKRELQQEQRKIELERRRIQQRHRMDLEDYSFIKHEILPNPEISAVEGINHLTTPEDVAHLVKGEDIFKQHSHQPQPESMDIETQGKAKHDTAAQQHHHATENAVREYCRNQLAKVLSIEHKLISHNDAMDLANRIEGEMYKMFLHQGDQQGGAGGGGTLDMKEYKSKFRTIHFNLQNNEILRKRVIGNNIEAGKLVRMSHKELDYGHVPLPLHRHEHPVVHELVPIIPESQRSYDHTCPRCGNKDEEGCTIENLNIWKSVVTCIK
eukprot:GEZU01025354.1.p1 GENE.GEZU01025354.1~~GEZU01025354.1.p1  ORF type:complete len:287 (-),score=60.63 GEZU01025354.1:215-1075(-)